MELSLQNLNKAAINNGVIIGILSAILGIVIFYTAPALFGSMGFGIGNMVFLLLVYIYFTLDLRKKIGGYWNFRQALKGIFLMAFVAGLIVAVFNFIFYKFIEPGAFATISGHVEEGLRSTFENMGMDEDAADQTVAKQIEQMRSQFDPTIKDFFTNLGIAIVVEFVLSLIFAAIFKKEAPIFAPSENDEA
ncbi:MAG TPA: DUF4199 domain-containing protein [Daejeonella sp.]